jgi:hypothetical protein
VRIRREKLQNKAYEYLANLRKKLNEAEGLEGITRLDSTLEVKTASGFTLSGGIPGIGTDENVFGKLIVLKDKSNFRADKREFKCLYNSTCEQNSF